MLQKTIAIKAPIQTVFDCITDFESYPRFLPDVKKTKVVWIDDNRMEVNFHLNLIKEICYTLLFDLDPPGGAYWKLKSGDLMKKNSGHWELKMEEDDLTKATYAIDLEFGLWVPKTITQTLIEKSLPQTLARFKKQAEKLFKRK